MNGFLVAQHRAFQLTQVYLVCQGKICELVGEVGKPIDIFARTMGFYRLGKGDWERLQTLSKNHESKSNDDENENEYKYCIEMIESYVQGINGWFSHPQCKYSVELTKLLKHKPALWTPIEVMAVFRILGFKMSYGWQPKILKTLIVQCVGYENAQWMNLDSHELAPPHCPYNDCKVKPHGEHLMYQSGQISENYQNFEINEFYKSLGNLINVPNDQPNVKDENINIGVENAVGSNAWAVGPEYTDTGHAMMG